MAEEIYIRLPEATAALGIDYQSVYRRRCMGKLPFIQRMGQGRGYLALSRSDLPKLARAFGVEVPAA